MGLRSDSLRADVVAEAWSHCIAGRAGGKAARGGWGRVYGCPSEAIPGGFFLGWVQPTKSLGFQEIGGLHPPYEDRF